MLVGFAVWATYSTTCCQDNARLLAEHNVLTSGHLAQRVGEHNIGFAVWATYTTTCCQDNARLLAEHNVLTCGTTCWSTQLPLGGYMHNVLITSNLAQQRVVRQRSLGDWTQRLDHR